MRALLVTVCLHLTYILLISPLYKLRGHNKVSPQPSLLQAEQPKLSQPFLIEEVFQPSDHFHGPPLDLLKQVHVFPVLRAPELDAGCQVGSHQRGGEGQKGDTVGLLGCEHILLGRVEFLINQDPQVLLLWAVLNPFILQSTLMLRITLGQVQNLALDLVEPHANILQPRESPKLPLCRQRNPACCLRLSFRK